MNTSWVFKIVSLQISDYIYFKSKITSLTKIFIVFLFLMFLL